MINENVIYAKSILKKLGITPDSPQWEDYQKIRKICGNSHGYVGILTKIRFLDGVDDFGEIESIFDIIKNSKLDIWKLNNLSYDEIIDLFGDEINKKSDNVDYEFVYSDTEYSYYRVYTYEGILKIGSPTWCLKTKKHWDEYNKAFEQMWVVIYNKVRKYLISPNNNYLSDYKSKEPYMRYGISITKGSNNNISFQAFNDNNIKIEFGPGEYTSFGVVLTAINLYHGIKKSYWENFFNGCAEPSKDLNQFGWCAILKVKDVKKLDSILKFGCTSTDGDVYLFLSKKYSFSPVILEMGHLGISYFGVKESMTVSGEIMTKFINSVVKSNPDQYGIGYSGIKLKLGLITQSEIESNPLFVMKIDKWLIFKLNSIKYFLVVNSSPGDYIIGNNNHDKYVGDENVIHWVASGKIHTDLVPFQKNIINTLFGGNKVNNYLKFIENMDGY